MAAIAGKTIASTTSESQNPLHYQWVLWENSRSKGDDYKNSMKEICEFSTIEEFWRYWAFLPKPSEIFADGRREISGRPLEGFSLFKKGIRPEWEDRENIHGCDLVSKKQIFGEIDIFWENLVFALIGETIEDDNEICGARLVEKVKKGVKSFFRIEIWMRNTNQDALTRIRDKLPEILIVDCPRVRQMNAEFEIKRRETGK